MEKLIIKIFNKKNLQKNKTKEKKFGLTKKKEILKVLYKKKKI